MIMGLFRRSRCRRFVPPLGLESSPLGHGNAGAASSDNETTAVEAGSQALWGNEGGDSDGLLVTSRSSRAPSGEGEDAFYISENLC